MNNMDDNNQLVLPAQQDHEPENTLRSKPEQVNP